jgi:hypothetical protein
MVRITKSHSGKQLLTQRKPAIAGLVLVLLFAACGNNESFNSAAWLKGDMRARGRMCEDLVRRKILNGQTDAEAQRLLGPPDQAYARTLSYKIDLGWPLKDPKHYGLHVHLDDNRNVREVKIVD